MVMSTPTKTAPLSGSSPATRRKITPSKRRDVSSDDSYNIRADGGCSQAVNAVYGSSISKSISNGINTNGPAHSGYSFGNGNNSHSFNPQFHGGVFHLKRPSSHIVGSGFATGGPGFAPGSGNVSSKTRRGARMRFFLGVLFAACGMAYLGLAFSLLKEEGVSSNDQVSQPLIRRPAHTHDHRVRPRNARGKQFRYNTVQLKVDKQAQDRAKNPEQKEHRNDISQIDLPLIAVAGNTSPSSASGLVNDSERKAQINQEAASLSEERSQSGLIVDMPVLIPRIVALGQDAYRSYQMIGTMPLEVSWKRSHRQLDLDPIFWDHSGSHDEVTEERLINKPSRNFNSPEEPLKHNPDEERPMKLPDPANVNNETIIGELVLNGAMVPADDEIDPNAAGKEDAVDDVNSKDEGSKCKPSGDWQTNAYLNCNTIHELDMGLGVSSWAQKDEAQKSKRKNWVKDSYNSRTEFFLLGQGWFRAAWKVDLGRFTKNRDLPNEAVVLKTLRTEREYLPEYYELHRRDAVAMERLTHSEFVMGVYGYCGQSAINELADFNHPTIKSLEQLNRATRGKSGDDVLMLKLRLAASIATGLAHVHEVNLPPRTKHSHGHRPRHARDSLPGMTHYDINPRNIAIVKGGKPKLNDFNIAEFLQYDPSTNKTCGFPSRLHEPWWRAPEEMDTSHQTLVNEKVDVYALGNVLFHTLTTHSPRGKMKKERMDEVREVVRRGEAPQLPLPFKESTNGIIKVFRKAMSMCFRADPRHRATAREVADLFQAALRKYSKKPQKPTGGKHKT